ncbi:MULTISPECIES: EF-hand domain-containing protein [Shimia]|uniref:EF-hand domain-containing protein n=1 Tax=Shimia TaxID=573139 RepID=UPI001FB292A4|nr:MULTISPECIES: EF-hand domain-containing protein [Shimia]MDV4143629.1 EF-hand domain-containing protein [Shimia sp. FJ5]
MKRAKLMSGVLAAALMMGGAAAYAEGKMGHGMHGPRPMMNFEEIDANADGKITKEEIAAIGATQFGKADADGDGFLSLEEMNARGLEMAKARIEARSAKMLERMDADKDGKLSMDEMQAMKDKGPRGKMMDRMFDRADADDDGAISQDEFDAAQARMQERMQDGKGGHKGWHKKDRGNCDGSGKANQ